MLGLMGFGPFRRSRSSIMGPGGRSGQIFEIFEILGGAGDINNSISMLNYCNGPYIRLLPCPNKVLGPALASQCLG